MTTTPPPLSRRLAGTDHHPGEFLPVCDCPRGHLGEHEPTCGELRVRDIKETGA